MAQGVRLIPVSGREVGVVWRGEEPNDEKVSGTPRRVIECATGQHTTPVTS